MVALRLAVAAEQDELAVAEQRVAGADDGRVDRLLDPVVGEQDVVAHGAVIERVEEVLAVGAGDLAFEAHVEHAVVEGLHLAGLEQVAVGEDDALVVGQQHAGVADRVDAVDGLGLFVEDQVAVQAFAVGQDLQQDERADDGVENLRVVERLVAFADGLGVDALAAGGVVLDLDGEVAADGLDEDAVLDRDVRVHAAAVHPAVGALPDEFLLGGIDDLVVEAVAEVFEGAVRVDAPLEGLDVVDGLAGPHLQVEMGADDHELLEDGLAVVLEEVGEVLREARVGEDLVNGQFGEAAGFRVVVVGGEDVLDVGRLLEAELDVVAEEEAVLADGDQVAGDAVVLGGDALGAEQGGLDAAEDVEAFGVQGIEAAAEGGGVLVEPGADDFIRAAFELVGFRG